MADSRLFNSNKEPKKTTSNSDLVAFAVSTHDTAVRKAFLETLVREVQPVLVSNVFELMRGRIVLKRQELEDLIAIAQDVGTNSIKSFLEKQRTTDQIDSDGYTPPNTTQTKSPSVG